MHKTRLTVSGNRDISYVVYKMTICNTGLYYFGITSDFKKRKYQHRRKRKDSKLRFKVLLRTRLLDIASPFENTLIQGAKNDPNCLNIQKRSSYVKSYFAVK